MIDFFNSVLPDSDIKSISSLGFAHIGDAVFELLIRAWICHSGKLSAAHMHKQAVQFVNAQAQSAFASSLLPHLLPEELDVFMRGRNAKVPSLPKNTSPSDYHSATALEALFGYLFLSGRLSRINELFNFLIGDLDNAT